MAVAQDLNFISAVNPSNAPTKIKRLESLAPHIQQDSLSHARGRTNLPCSKAWSQKAETLIHLETLQPTPGHLPEGSKCPTILVQVLGRYLIIGYLDPQGWPSKPQSQIFKAGQVQGSTRLWVRGRQSGGEVWRHAYEGEVAWQQESLGFRVF